MARKLEKFTCFCPASLGNSSNSDDPHGSDDTTLETLIIILLIHWEVVKWISRLLKGAVVVGKEDCGSEVGKIHVSFLPQAWETHPTVMTLMAEMIPP